MKRKNSITPGNEQNTPQPQLTVMPQSLQSKSSLQRQGKILNQRKPMGFSIYFIFIIGMIVLAFQNILFYFVQISNQKTYYCIFTITVFTIIFLLISKCFANFRQMLALYFLIDSLALALIAANIGLSGVLSPLSKADPFFANVLSYFGPFASFFVTGTIRIVIKKVNFNRWQNIIFKIVILADALCYFVLGFFLMYTNHKKTHGMLPKIDLLHKDFSLLFVFGGIAYYKQVCNLHNRFDQTNKLNYTYKLIDEVEQQFIDEQNQNQSVQSNQQEQNKSKPLIKYEYKIKRKEKINIIVRTIDQES